MTARTWGQPPRDEVAYLATTSRGGSYAIWGSTVRLVLAVVAVRVVWSGSNGPVVSLFLLPATIGPVLALASAAQRYVEAPFPLIRAYEDHLRRTHGEQGLNVTAVLELAGSVLLLSAALLVSGETAWRPLAVLGCGAFYLAGVVVAIFTDPAWYNPGTTAPTWQRWFRVIGAPVVAALVLTPAVAGPWDAAETRAGVVLAVLTGAYVAVGVDSVDRSVRTVIDRAGAAREAGSTQVLVEMQHSLHRPLTDLLTRTAGLADVDPTLVRLTQTAATRYGRIADVVRRGVSDDDLIEVGDQLVILAQAAACTLTLAADAPLEAAEDRALAARCLQDLVGNAIDAGAGQISASVTVADGSARVQVIDDGPPMAAGVWQARGTSSAGLVADLRRRDGDLVVTTEAPGKRVAGSWRIRG